MLSNKNFKLVLSKKIIIVNLLLGLYVFAGLYYTLIKKHTLQEWIIFSTSPRRVGNRIKDVIVKCSTYRRECHRVWDKSEEWNRYLENPILTPGSAGLWDACGTTFASIIRNGDEYKMYYQGWNADGRHQIGLATSPDGKNWSKYVNNPVLPVGVSGSWDECQVRVPMVWKEYGICHMLYTGQNSSSVLQVGHAVSEDGINWTKDENNPVFNDPNVWAHDHTENWGLIKIENIYLLWYSTVGKVPREMSFATSTDLVNWLPCQDKPIFASIPDTDREHQFCAFPFKYKDWYYLLVPSQDKSKNYTVFYLYRCRDPYFLPDDREIVKKALLPGDFGCWDDHDMDTPFILTTDIYRDSFNNDELRLYYSAENGDDRWKEGLIIEKDIDGILKN